MNDDSISPFGLLSKQDAITKYFHLVCHTLSPPIPIIPRAVLGDKPLDQVTAI